MKSAISILIIVILSPYTQIFAQKRSKSEIQFIKSLEQIESEELWEMREYAQDKFQSNVVSGSIITGWGLSSVATGAIFMASSNSDISKSGQAFLGGGVLVTIIGIAITSSASKHRKRDLWIQKELWIRDETSLSLTPTGVRLTFGK